MWRNPKFDSQNGSEDNKNWDLFILYCASKWIIIYQVGIKLQMSQFKMRLNFSINVL